VAKGIITVQMSAVRRWWFWYAFWLLFALARVGIVDVAWAAGWLSRNGMNVRLEPGPGARTEG
jgi:hypothetical protein